MKAIASGNTSKMINTRLPKELIKKMKLARLNVDAIQEFMTQAVGEKLKAMNY